MNWEQIKGIVERIVTVGLTWLAAKGYIPNDQVANIVSIVVLVGAVVWGWKVNTTPSLVSATAALPEVNKVVVNSPKLAANTSQPGATVSTQ